MYSFEYQRATDPQAAAAAIAADSDAKFLAGGQSLLPTMRLRLAQPSQLIDVTRIPALKSISVEANVVKIGAAVCHADVADHAEVRRALPALADLAAHIGDRQVRALGTLGGSLANNDPAACYPAAAMGLDATIVTQRRRISSSDFFVGMYETALEPDELIVGVEFPVPERAAYEKFRNPASHFALVGVFVAKFAGGVRVAVTGAAASVFRVPELESALSANFTPEAARAVNLAGANLNDDMHASAEYRAHLIPVLAARAVAKANS
ncbi:xanthine dehydrogenase family protein subunit M [bacterium M00.F.Ca.ET.228.01.1.1]|uniref:FAD binding domain-containing protein n=1 Tax=Paraburkholderia phenoliruptrix TaxID=252970 RepID=UPI001091C865|nr:xanthine dehydrogenase family protein subunit M [Paraburkholderia phenoliruptrix]TGP44812.1 xanthine dehydrogenase family protein subunit M [bacterium M00.F.Ca.ET.228.01.1.1]TGS02695.1 xanthine dehydrogenase family protein subunit M [bacterium M00.F.Ca.ET.191.01.1.1]TGU06077.1 xanthine dehydrogenase family protein subunit M [bacterium M00.F.Ca.ET.155.01.1.1]MBW0448060.1 xanthine dehydrogenase family protein subunit M [Paraburkholderia phenoliruptrix]MBW9098105.1 xanthine dehydrogenase famil